MGKSPDEVNGLPSISKLPTIEGGLLKKSIKERMASGFTYSIMSSLAAQLINLVSTIVSAQILGKEMFGQLNMVRSTLLMFGVFAGTGLGIAATKYVAEYRRTDPGRLGKILFLIVKSSVVLGGVATSICFFLSHPLSVLIFNDENFSLFLKIGSVLLFFSTIGGVQNGIVAGFENFQLLARVVLVEVFLSSTFFLGGVWFFGIEGALSGLVISSTICFFIKQAVTHRSCKNENIKIKKGNLHEGLSELFSCAVPATLVNISIQPFEWYARLLLVKGPGGYAELGLFSVAYSWGQFVLFIPSQIYGAVLPIFTSEYSVQSNKTNMKRLLLIISILTFGASLFVSVPLLIFSKKIMGIYGSGFSVGWNIFNVMVMAYAVGSLSGVFRSILISLNKTWGQLYVSILWGLILISCAFIFSSLGAIGLAFGYLLAYFIVVIIQGILSFLSIKTQV